ncbi:MAG TPA: hypothetical protein VI139_08165 [Gemmatimonadales bacterium]
MQIGEIMIWRDGGTISFTIDDGALAGRYRLRTPFAGEPRPLYRDDVALALGGPDEAALLDGLRAWWATAATDEAQRALTELDGMREWRSLREELTRVLPLHRIRDVIRCLEAREG